MLILRQFFKRTNPSLFKFEQMIQNQLDYDEHVKTLQAQIAQETR
jgi:hypothetical protein